MTNIPTIPVSVPLCHKNFHVAQELCKVALNEEPVTPPFVNPKSFEALKKCFGEWATQNPEIQNPWEYIESFFEYLKDLPGDEGDSSEGEALASVDLEDKNNSKEQSVETILDFKETQDRETSELQERVLSALEGVDKKELIAYVNKVNDAIDKSFAFKRSTPVEDQEFKRFDVVDLKNMSEIAKTNQKAMMMCEELEDLFFYRAVTGQLSKTASITSEKKTLFVMIDDSGSMNDSFKKAIVNFTILKTKEKLSSKVNAFVFSFESDLYDEYTHLNESLPEMSFDGGGTDISRAIKTLFEKMKKWELNQYSILVINDGEDSIKDIKPPCKVNSLIIKTRNEALSAMCRKSGGVSYNI